MTDVLTHALTHARPHNKQQQQKGFYYLALERATGALKGLYHDPASCPYQELDLHAARAPGGAGYAFGAAELR